MLTLEQDSALKIRYNDCTSLGAGQSSFFGYMKALQACSKPIWTGTAVSQNREGNP
jgi:hypothetical protein